MTFVVLAHVSFVIHLVVLNAWQALNFKMETVVLAQPTVENVQMEFAKYQ